MRKRLPGRFDQILAAQLFIRRDALSRVLRSERTASDEEPRPVDHGVLRDPAPEQMQQVEIAMRFVHAGATQLDHLCP